MKVIIYKTYQHCRIYDKHLTWAKIKGNTKGNQFRSADRFDMLILYPTVGDRSRNINIAKRRNAFGLFPGSTIMFLSCFKSSSEKLEKIFYY
jgi:hypothetical protein